MGFVLGQQKSMVKTTNKKFVLGSDKKTTKKELPNDGRTRFTSEEIQQLNAMRKPEPKTFQEKSKLGQTIEALGKLPQYVTDKNYRNKIDSVTAPAGQKILGTITRPLDSVRNATASTLKEAGTLDKFDPIGNAPKLGTAFVEGLTGKRQTSSAEIMPEFYRKWSDEHPKLSFLPNMVLDVVTDPTTYIGGAGLLKVEKAIEAKLGRKLVASESAAAKTLIKQAAIDKGIDIEKGVQASMKSVDVQKAAGVIETPSTIKQPVNVTQKPKFVLGKQPTSKVEVPVENTVNKVSVQMKGSEAKKTFEPEIHIEDRTFENVGDRKVKSYQYNHPELKTEIQTEANILKTELKGSVKGEITAIKDDTGYITSWTGTKKFVSESIERIQNATGASYEDIENALEAIIKDHGAENTALAKRVELVIDDNLSKGVKRLEGFEQEPNFDYVEKKMAIDEANIKASRQFTPSTTTQTATTTKTVPKKFTAKSSNAKITAFKPKSADVNLPENKSFMDDYEKTLPETEVELRKAIEQLEAETKNIKTELPERSWKLNLQLFAAKKKLEKIFTEIPRGPLPEGEVERGMSKNIRTDSAMPDEVREVFDEKPLGYKELGNEETLAKAEKIMEGGQASAISEFYTLLNGKKYAAESVPLAKLIAKKAAETGDIDTARQVLSDVAVKLTEAGQFSQAAKILREGDPQSFILTLQKQLTKLNKEGKKFYGKKWKELSLTNDEIGRIGQIQKGDDAAYEAMMEEVHNRIAQDVPSNAWEKFDSWRRMAMLLNPTTHIRNLVGNTIMGGMQKTSDTVGAILERVFVKPEERTKSLLWRADKNRVKLVEDSWEANRKQLMKGGRWDLESSLGTLKELNSIKPVFKTKPLEAVNKLSKDLLNAEDNIFVKAVFQDSLGQFLKARNLNTITDEAIEYATRRAYEATFKQANLLSTMITRIKSVPVVGRFAEGAVPFSKTPSNIAMRAFEYSPAGIMKALYSATAKKGAAAVIEDLSKSLTGTGIAALGFGLAAAGWARGKSSLSEKVEALKTKQGEQANSITTPLGSYTVDWAQPFAIPLFTGIAMYEELQNPKYSGKLSESIINSIYKGGDTLFEMTMLKNIKQLLGYGSTTQKIGMMALAYIEQAVPTVLGKMARSIDPTQRETYDPNPAKEEWNKIAAKLPGLSRTLPEKVDNFGEAVKNGGVLSQFFSPGYAKGKDDRPFMRELERLYKVDKDTDIIPKVISGKFTEKNVDYVMTADELEAFKKAYGKTIMEGYAKNGYKFPGLNAITTSSGYKQLNDKAKKSRITKLYDRAYEEAKKGFLKNKGVK